jgi:hypothetical protein
VVVHQKAARAGNLETSTKRQNSCRPYCLPLSADWRASPIAPRKKAKDAARRDITEVVSRGFRLFERITTSIHNALNRVIASRAEDARRS